ncbi:MAG TPA: hypothetical protein V6D50_26360 [Chroococcales cyanobacterium]|jgi:hypothetical protein
MGISDSFSFWVNSDVCEIVTHSQLPKDRLTFLLDFVFKAYAPIAIISQSMNNTEYAYTFAQLGSTIDLDKLLRILSQCEMGWSLSDNVLFSPRPSQLNFNDLMRAISAARMPRQKAQLFPVPGDR